MGNNILITLKALAWTFMYNIQFNKSVKAQENSITEELVCGESLYTHKTITIVFTANVTGETLVLNKILCWENLCFMLEKNLSSQLF